MPSDDPHGGAGADVLIVGAGSAGSVLAERFSVDERCRVTVLEAGPGPHDPRVSTQITDGLRLPIGVASSVVQRFTTVLTDHPVRRAHIVRGAVVGGSGAVNGGYFCRALPADVEEWNLDGWRWADVLPHFQAIENDLDFPGEPHGSSGPITVRRVVDFDGCTASFVASCRDAGYPWLDDLNGATPQSPLSAGIGAVPLNIERGTRVGPGGAFLGPALQRSNVSLRSDTRAHRILLRQGRAVAVECVGPSGALTLTADRIVICAGAIGSAHLLMLSGIGPQDVLRATGIDVVADLPVGLDTVDHPEWVLPVSWQPTHGVPPLEAVLTTHDGIEIRPYTTGFGAMLSGRRDDPTDRPHLGITLMRPRSRGRVTLASADPQVAPLIEHRYDSEPADVAQLREGTELARNLAGASAGEEAFWATSQHLCGTARMGATGDDSAVVDRRCRVRGIEGLWVIDGSVLPDIPSRGPHATIVMAGHRAAEFVS